MVLNLRELLLETAVCDITSFSGGLHIPIIQYTIIALDAVRVVQVGSAFFVLTVDGH